ncbi:putative quinol monooxygenase [Agromyces albus]|uniref:putative quinol monooxygenase n=1 Tax=Agromyces albus TaxID=205332 RepID=UPI0027884519|nr:antibiotic biosynthesis monooxygenase family protein [Agromyces albus]MDQ0574309.1 quinol monooxygenase YgiN [Agromyces albus]
MLIIAGYLELDPNRRDDYVAAHTDLIARARQADGCLDLAISADSVHETRVNLFERWKSEEALEAWRATSNPPQLDVQFVGGDVMKYTIDHVSPAFD